MSRSREIKSFTAADVGALRRCHVLASPTTRLPGFRLGEGVNDPVAMYLNDMFVVGAKLAGLPAISIPAGFAPTVRRPWFPVGLQLVAPPPGEQIQPRIAATWHSEAPPGLAS